MACPDDTDAEFKVARLLMMVVFVVGLPLSDWRLGEKSREQWLAARERLAPRNSGIKPAGQWRRHILQPTPEKAPRPSAIGLVRGGVAAAATGAPSGVQLLRIKG